MLRPGAGAARGAPVGRRRLRRPVRDQGRGPGPVGRDQPRSHGPDRVWSSPTGAGTSRPGRGWTCRRRPPASTATTWCGSWTWPATRPGRSTSPSHWTGRAGDAEPEHRRAWTGAATADDATARWYNELPALSGESALLCQILDQTSRDLLALRVETSLDGHALVLPAAGLPWFLTVFGRDTLITAYQSLVFGQELARGALLELAAMQGTAVRRLPGRGARQDPARDPAGRADPVGPDAAQPVLRHRRRDHAVADPAVGVLALVRRRGPGAPARPRTRGPRWSGSTGTATATATATSSTRRGPAGTGQPVLARLLGRGAVRRRAAAVPPDGHLPSCRATCTTPRRGWPSWPTGRWATPELADRLRTRRPALKERFNRDFWIDERGGYYAVGLDGDKRPDRLDDLEHGPSAVERHRAEPSEPGSSPGT